MRNELLLLLTCFTFQRSLYAFHKESYYGDPYSMEYVGKFSTVNLTKDDFLFADYIVEMLRNTSYTTIDFNASITYPLRFQQYYATGVTTMATRRFATTSTKSPTKEKKWQFPENEYIFGTEDLWKTTSSILSRSRAKNSNSCKLQEKFFGSSLLIKKSENRHYESRPSQLRNFTTLCIQTTKDKFENVRDIIKRNIIKKPSYKYIEKQNSNETSEGKKVSLVKPDPTTTRKRRSLPYFLNSDSGPWLTSKEQEQVWALRGTSLLDSEKYDFPFPYDFDKWPGCTTKDLSDPKNTIHILEYENGHVRFIGISKPGWNEFPWKPTEFTTAYPVYRRLDKYLTYLSRPWYGYYSTLYPTLLKKWDKKTTQAWSRYTFPNLSRTMYDHDGEKLKWSKKWMIDKWPPDWNRTVYFQSTASTRKRIWWGGKWPFLTRYFFNTSAEFSKPVPDTVKSNANTTKLNTQVTKSILIPRKPSTTKLKSTSGFGFLSLSPTWYTFEDYFSNVTSFRPSNATWLSEWSKVWYRASKLALNTTPWVGVWNDTSDLSLMGRWSKEISLPLYTHPKTLSTKSWLDLEEWITKPETEKYRSTWSTHFYNTKPKQWNRGILNQWDIKKPPKWSTWSKLNKGGWSLPALTKVCTKQWGREQPASWSKTWYTKSNYYSKQYPAGSQRWSKVWNKNESFLYTNSYGQYLNQRNIGKEQQREWSPWSSQYRRVSPWTNQWEMQQPKTWSRSWYTTKPYQYRPNSKQSVGGWSKQWNEVGSRTWSKPYWYTTKVYRPFSNQRTWQTRSWFTRENLYY